MAPWGNARASLLRAPVFLDVTLVISSYEFHGRVHVAQRDAETQKLFPPLLHVHWSPKLPDDAHIGVRYCDHRSKAAFNFLMLLFSLTETGATQSAPIVTLPAR